MHRTLPAILAGVLVLASAGVAFAQVTNTPPSSVGSPSPGGPVAVQTPPASVSLARRPPTPPPPPLVPCQGGGLGQANSFAGLATPGTTDFRPGSCNPFDNPHPMLPWGDGQIGGERYGQVIRYWENQPKVVSDVIFVELPVEQPPTPEAVPPVPEPPAQNQPGTSQGQPSAPQAVLEGKLHTKPQKHDVTVPGSWIVETTRGYIHMPRWALQEVGGGRYQWVLIGAWFQPR